MSLEQGWQFEDPISALSNIYGFLYFFLAKEMTESFGEQGEEALRRALTAYGNYRGRLLRERHEQQGITPNIKSFWENYDLPYDKRTTRNRHVIAEYESYSECYTCQFNDIWRLLEKTAPGQACKLGYIYCETFYKAMCQGSSPNMVLEFPQNLARGDSHCAIFATLE